MITPEKDIKLPKINFPTAWQAVIYRNYGLVKTQNIANVLNCSAETVELEAKRLGLGSIKYNPMWEEKGYITILRNNWYLLNMGQIQKLLNFSEEKLDFLLKEEDFLFVKLNNDKPICPEISYQPLTDVQILQTKNINDYLIDLGSDEGKPFEFFNNMVQKVDLTETAPGNRIIYGYLTPCNDVFMIDSQTYLSDALLCRYQQAGITGIWLHSVLSTLSHYPFCEELSYGYEKRRDFLKDLIIRCKKFGIKVYLYLNEPRCLDVEKFGKYKSIMGHVNGNVASLCMTEKATQDYLYNAVYDLVKNVPDLGGFITITMSENMTHCYSTQNKTNCKKCQNVKIYEAPVMINNIIMKAVKDSETNVEVIANLWCWFEDRGFTPEIMDLCIKLLDKDISIMCVSEFGLKFEKNGTKYYVGEYSISNVGPSENSKFQLQLAKKYGHKIYAKIQINNTWECSGVPCLPVFDLEYKHLSNLRDIGIENFMLSWTLGGYPSISLNLVNAFCNGLSLSEWYKAEFGDIAPEIQRAISIISESFTHFPYSMNSLYYSPKNLAHGNMWEIEKEEKYSAMVSYSFDISEKWVFPYGEDKYLKLMSELLSGWKKGLAILEKFNDNEKVKKLITYAKGAYLLFKADHDQTLFSVLKLDLDKNKQRILDLLNEVVPDVKEMIELQKQEPSFGYEASNHYFFNVRLLKEKLLNIQRLIAELN